MTTTHPLTVIIPVYGPGPNLRAVVEALQKQDPPVHHIIVSHSGSGDPSNLLKDKSNLTVLHSETRRFAGAARNRGLRLATTEWVAFIDEDIIVDRAWHAAAQACIARGDVDAVSGSVGFATTGGYWGMSRWFFEFSSAHPYLKSTFAITGGSPNLVIKRRAFLDIGGFPEDWRMAEDVYAMTRFAVAGNSIFFEPGVVGRHVNISGFRWMVRHVYHFGRWTAKVRRAYPHLPGGSAVQRPVLSLGLWLARTAQLYARVYTARNGPHLSLLYHTPGILAAMIAWNVGFTCNAFGSTDRESRY